MNSVALSFPGSVSWYPAIYHYTFRFHILQSPWALFSIILICWKKVHWFCSSDWALLAYRCCVGHGRASLQIFWWLPYDSVFGFQKRRSEARLHLALSFCWLFGSSWWVRWVCQLWTCSEKWCSSPHVSRLSVYENNCDRLHWVILWNLTTVW